MIGTSRYGSIREYLKVIRSKGRLAVTLDELKENFDSSEKAILQNVFRLKRKNELAQVRREFYVIIPPEYSHRAMVPPSLFIDDLMRFFQKKGYQ